ncbi:MAG: hypothetical protein ACPGJS_03565 [Flammeovirgaceae bacterium]
MIYNGQEIEFPAIMHVSFFKHIENLEKQAQSEEKYEANYAKSLLKEVEKYPELRDGIHMDEDLEQYQESIRKLCKPLFPDVLTTNEIKVLTPLFYFKPLMTSTRFDAIIEASGEEFEYTMKDVDADMLYLYCCFFILGKHYGLPVYSGNSQHVKIFNKQQDLIRTYKILVNADMTEFIPTDQAKKITQADYEELMANIDDIDLWKSKFPPNSWIFRGVSITNLVDVTIDQSVTSIASNLLVKSPDTFEKVEWGIRKMLGSADFSIGVLLLQEDKLVPMGREGVTSVLLHDHEILDCASEMCTLSFSRLLRREENFVITNTQDYYQEKQSPFAKRLVDGGINSYMLIPIRSDNEFLGYLELASPRKFALHKGTTQVLENITPSLAIAHQRFLAEEKNAVEAIIQQECTTIHPSVKWRFEEEAVRFIDQELRGEQPVFEDIIFENLYPLYGQMDIKGSSVRRNKAVSADLIKQIDAVNRVLKAAHGHMKLPILNELRFRANNFKDGLRQGLAAGSEHKILNFLRSEVYPVFEHLEQINETLRALIQGYRSLLDPELQTIYDERKKYDTSVNYINQRLAAFIDKRQVEAQEMFPHYFERYKTDGIEYNIYIGNSITQNKKFNELFLRNLRLWQLIVMYEMENEFRSIQKELDTNIEIASLILVYNTAISVHFRMDEKQFDVEGAYNARYEIIKKRVDKANIKGTNERITKPGNIVIVYSQPQDAQEYHDYLEYMISEGYIEDDVEDLALEDLQGVRGLRALRAKVIYTQNRTVEALMEKMSG